MGLGIGLLGYTLGIGFWDVGLGLGFGMLVWDWVFLCRFGTGFCDKRWVFGHWDFDMGSWDIRLWSFGMWVREFASGIRIVIVSL